MKETIQRKLSKTCVSANILDVEIIHNGIKGGDAGHGGFVQLKLSSYDSTSYDVDVKYKDSNFFPPNHYKYKSEKGITIREPNSVTLTFYGDCERDTLIEALEFALKELKDNEIVNESFESHEEPEY
jgi:hypothetical protein